MAQFDVHRNSGAHRQNIPYVVVVQSAIFDGYGRRVVVPLVRKSALGPLSNAKFNPTFNIEGVEVVLHPLEMVSVPCTILGQAVGSLGDEAERIIAALDELLSRAWG